MILEGDNIVFQRQLFGLNDYLIKLFKLIDLNLLPKALMFWKKRSRKVYANTTPIVILF